MNESEDKEQEEQYPIDLSLQLSLLSSILNLAGDVVEALADMEAINEDQLAQKEEEQHSKQLDERFQAMQKQIDTINEKLK